MPTCQNCGNQWSFKDTFKVAFKFDGNTGKKCSHCGKKQYVSKSSKTKTGTIGIVTVVLSAVLFTYIDQDMGTSLLLAMPIVLLLILANIFMTELSNERETLR